ncbi:MAG: hypothetical protein IPN92_16735 [Chromatiaceae bacterium]|nr:hypothetical protein [Chromatiaceae bacterium]
MPAVTLKAHYDGRAIQLDEPFTLAPDTRLLVTVLEPGTDTTRALWATLSARGLARAYGDDEPEYGPDDLRQP